jgi:hypothetical protein
MILAKQDLNKVFRAHLEFFGFAQERSCHRMLSASVVDALFVHIFVSLVMAVS